MKTLPMREIIAAAIAAGVHSTTFRTVCSGCGQWVSGIFHVGTDGQRLCRDCAPADPRPLTAADLDKLRHPDDRRSAIRYADPAMEAA